VPRTFSGPSGKVRPDRAWAAVERGSRRRRGHGRGSRRGRRPRRSATRGKCHAYRGGRAGRVRPEDSVRCEASDFLEREHAWGRRAFVSVGNRRRGAACDQVIAQRDRGRANRVLLALGLAARLLRGELRGGGQLGGALRGGGAFGLGLRLCSGGGARLLALLCELRGGRACGLCLGGELRGLGARLLLRGLGIERGARLRGGLGACLLGGLRELRSLRGGALGIAQRGEACGLGLACGLGVARLGRCEARGLGGGGASGGAVGLKFPFIPAGRVVGGGACFFGGLRARGVGGGLGGLGGARLRGGRCLTVKRGLSLRGGRALLRERGGGLGGGRALQLGALVLGALLILHGLGGQDFVTLLRGLGGGLKSILGGPRVDQAGELGRRLFVPGERRGRRTGRACA